MRSAFTITWLDIRRRLRDRSLVVQGIIAPIALALVVSAAFSDGPSIDFAIGVIDEDHSATTMQIAADLGASSENGLTFVAVDRDAAVAAIGDEDLAAALVLPAGFDRSVSTGAQPSIDVLVDPAHPIGGEIAEQIAASVASRVDGARLAVAAVPDDPLRAAQLAGRAEPPITLATEPVSGDYDIGSYFAPSMAILFLFLTIGAGARSLMLERREGTLTRLRSTPTTPGQIVAGKTAAVFVVGLASFLTVYGVTTLAGTDWGSSVAVVAVIVATTAAVAALSMFVTALARTDAQAEAYTAALTFGLALLGGNFVTPDAAPDLLQAFGRLTPNGWALQSFTELSAGAADLADIVPSIIVLSVIAVGAGAVGLLLTSRKVNS